MLPLSRTNIQVRTGRSPCAKTRLELLSSNAAQPLDRIGGARTAPLARRQPGECEQALARFLQETTPPSIPTTPATAPRCRARDSHWPDRRFLYRADGEVAWAKRQRAAERTVTSVVEMKLSVSGKLSRNRSAVCRLLAIKVLHRAQMLYLSRLTVASGRPTPDSCCALQASLVSAQIPP
jgi:hypothetical protein